jgi:uncharacterized repeat protein (TIGR03803 family)
MKNISPLFKRTIGVALTLQVLFLVLFLAGVVVPAQAQTPTVLHSFLSGSTDVCEPEDNIVQGRDGNMYGVGVSCGNPGTGGVYKISTTGTESVVFNFPSTWSTCLSGLTLGIDGNFYGTCFTNPGGNGGIFQLTPAGVFTDKHDFTNTNGDTEPVYGPIQAADGNFYGVTGYYPFSCGNVYKLTAAGVYTSLHTFSGSDCGPASSLIQASDGNLYGTLNACAINASGGGCVYKISTAGVFTEIYGFASSTGDVPCTGVIQGKDGKLYGATSQGAANGIGNIYKVTTAGVQTDFHDFNNTTDAECGNNVGRTTVNLLQVNDGNFYGVNGLGGPNGTGSIYKLTSAGVFTAFLFPNPAVDGNFPLSTLLQNTNGTVYGTTPSGGPTSCNPCQGVFFSVATGDPAFVLLQETSGKVGSKIGILGQGFSASSVVKFNGVKATTVTETGTTFLLATVPTGATDGRVTVTTGATTLTSAQKFTVHNSWSSGTALPTAVQFPAAGFIANKIYLVGGVTSTAIVADNQVYTPATNTWATAAVMPTPVWGSASAVVNGILYVIGGYTTTSNTPTNVVQAYNPTTNTWSTKTAMPTARGSAAAVVDNGLVYVIGGNGSTLRLDTVEKFDPATDIWTTEAPLLVGKSEPSAGLLGTTIVAAGGYTSSAQTGDNEGYNVATNTWSGLAFDPTHRNASCDGALLGQLYVAGGYASGIGQTSTTESFNVATNKWTTQAAMLQAVIAPGSAVGNGLLYCFGGSDSGTALSGTVYNNLQIYQP